MNAVIHLEHRAGSSRGKHEGEPSFALCDRLDRTRDNSQRQLPTDHDYAVPTREYQTDQSSLKTAPTAARSVFGKQQKQQQKQTHRWRRLTRSLHIRAIRPSTRSTQSVFLASGRKTDFALTRRPERITDSQLSRSESNQIALFSQIGNSRI